MGEKEQSQALLHYSESPQVLPSYATSCHAVNGRFERLSSSHRTPHSAPQLVHHAARLEWIDDLMHDHSLATDNDKAITASYYVLDRLR